MKGDKGQRYISKYGEKFLTCTEFCGVLLGFDDYVSEYKDNPILQKKHFLTNL